MDDSDVPAQASSRGGSRTDADVRGLSYQEIGDITIRSVSAEISLLHCGRDQLDWFDREIVHYVLLWAPEGDVWDEDVYPLFGMTVEQLVDRFHRIIATFVPRLGYLAKSDRELLDKVRNLRRIFGQPETA